MVDPAPRTWRLHALLSTVPIGLWASVHLWEQWAGFGGREAWLARMGGTTGTFGTLLDVGLGVLPFLGWLVLEVSLRRRGEPPELRLAYGEEPAAAERMGRLAVGAGWVLLAFVTYHVAWLWAPRATGALELAALWARLQMHLGSWVHAAPHAVGLGALAVHLAFAPARLLTAFGWVVDGEGRRAARLSGAIVAILFFVLYGQLAGWHATGAGTFWSLSP